jgi:hypothetical protein
MNKTQQSIYSLQFRRFSEAEAVIEWSICSALINRQFEIGHTKVVVYRNPISGVKHAARQILFQLCHSRPSGRFPTSSS